MSGRRDFAILALLSRLGLRAGEVAGLGLEDIDWRAGQILVRGKGRSERLPLPADVGEAIADYLRRGPAGERRGAHRLRLSDGAPPDAHRPHCRRGRGERRAARRVLARCAAHRLRHTAATQALRAGASLPEVGQLLRHHRIATTAIYAKVDREALRGIARPWPARCPMSPLGSALADYLTVRRALGHKLVKVERLLGQFVTYLEERGAKTIKIEEALAWATLPGGTRAWHCTRLSAVRGFAAYLQAIDPACEVPREGADAARSPRATPYIYSESELAALLEGDGQPEHARTGRRPTGR